MQGFVEARNHTVERLTGNPERVAGERGACGFSSDRTRTLKRGQQLESVARLIAIALAASLGISSAAFAAGPPRSPGPRPSGGASVNVVSSAQSSEGGPSGGDGVYVNRLPNLTPFSGNDSSGTEVGVSGNTGQAAYQIAIEVPKGTAGSEPNLALAYTSTISDGPFGVGWQLGLGQIARTLRFGTPSYDSTDQFEFNGQLLVSDASHAGEFRTMAESFAKIVHTASSSDDHWTVNFPNGQIARFGTNQESRIRTGGDGDLNPENDTGAIAQWLLTEIEDASGNITRYVYDRSVDPGTAFPKAIEYTYRDEIPVGEIRSVEFILEDRPDFIYGFPGGVETRVSKRVREIQSLAGGEIYRRLLLRYDSPGSATTQRSRLTSAQVFGTDCPVLEDPETPSDPDFCNGLPAETFTYTDASDVIADEESSQWTDRTEPADYWHIPEVLSFGFDQHTGRDAGVRIQDIDGDGLADFVAALRWVNYDNQNLAEDWVRVYLNDGTGWRIRSTQWEDRIRDLTFWAPASQGEVADYWPPDEGWPMTCWAFADNTDLRHVVFHDEGAYSTRPGQDPYWDRPVWGPIEAQFLDLNGDGLADILLSFETGGETHTENSQLPYSTMAGGCEATGSWHSEPDIKETHIWLNTGDPETGWEEVTDWDLRQSVPPFYSIYHRNEQGNMTIPADNVGQACSPGANQAWGTHEAGNAHYLSKVYWQDHGVRIADLNGDGRPDFVAKRDPATFGLDGTIEPPYETPRTGYTFLQGAWLSQPDDEFGAFGGWEYNEDYTPPVSIVAEHRYLGDTRPRWVRDADAGVRFVDLNGDGLDDMIKTALAVNNNATLAEQGVWLNTGSGWCGPDQTQTCDEAQTRYMPPEGVVFTQLVPAGATDCATELITPFGDRVSPTSLRFADVNDDGFIDLLSSGDGSSAAWIHDPSAAAGAGDEVWVENLRFRPPIPLQYSMFKYSDMGSRMLDVDGNGSLDIIRYSSHDDYYGPRYRVTEYGFAFDGNKFQSNSAHADLLRQIDNGQGGTTQIEYASAITQRTTTLEEEADADVTDTGEAGLIGLTRWSSTPVVTRITTNDNLAGGESHETAFAYARPQFDLDLNSGLGFRLVETTHLDDQSTQVRFFWQQPGIAGQTSRVAIYDSNNALRSEQITDWEILADSSAIPGSIAGVKIGRQAFESGSTFYGAAGAEVAGATRTATTTYDDSYGYNFVKQIDVSRPLGVLTVIRTPETADTDEWIVGLVESETHQDQTNIFQSQSYEYVVDRGLLKSVTKTVQPTLELTPLSYAVTNYEYDDHGNVTRVTDPEGRVTQLCYDGDSEFSDGTTCTYDTQGTTHSVPVATKDALGEVTSFDWELGGRAIARVDEQYNGNQKGVEVDALGRQVEYWVQPSGYGKTVLETRLYHDDPWSASNNADRAYIERFREVGDGTTVRSASYADGLGRTAWTVAPQTPEDNRFGRATFLRDHAGRPLKATLALSCDDTNCTNLSDPAASSDPTVATTYDALGRPTTRTGPDGVAVFDYRQAGFSIPTGANAGNTVSLDVVLAKDPNGNLREELRDGDRLILANECSNTVSPDATDLSSVSCTTPDSTYYEYLPNGAIAKIYDATVYGGSTDYANAAHRIEFNYDTLGRRLETVNPDAGTSHATYDLVGNIIQTTDARELVVGYAYDALNRVTAIDRPAGIGETDLTITYDPITRQRASVTSNSTYQETWEYNRFGRVERNTKTELSQSMMTDYTTDLLGRPTKIIYPARLKARFGVTHRYQGAYLVALCGKIQFRFCETAPSGFFIEGVDYDSLGRVATIQAPPGDLDYSYYSFQDAALGRSVHAIKSMVLGTGESYNLSYEYDSLGNVTRVDDAHSILLGDCTGGLEDCDDASASYAYDPRNRLSSWAREVSGGPTKHFAYDSVGNLVGRDLDSAAGRPADWNQAYANANHPHQLTTSHSAKTYAYDASGNVEERDGVYFRYNSAGQLACRGAAPGQCDTTFSYDMDGNLLSKTTASSQEFYSGKTFRWIPASQQAYFSTYAFGRRLTRQYLQGTGVILRGAAPLGFPFLDSPSQRPWLLGALAGLALLLLLAHFGALETLAEHPATVSLALALTALLAIPQPIWGMGRGSTVINIVNFVFQDNRGTEVLTTTPTGNVEQWRVYEPFGEVLASWSGASTVERRLEGHRWDDDLDLYNFGARWYDSDSGRFMAVDPLIPNPADPQDHNPYGYVRNNPVNMVDPSGMRWEYSYSDNADGSITIYAKNVSSANRSVGIGNGSAAGFGGGTRMSGGVMSSPSGTANASTSQINSSQSVKQSQIDNYQSTVDRLTADRNLLETLAESEEAEISRIDEEFDAIMGGLDVNPDDSAGESIATFFGILGGGREFLRDQTRRLGELGKERSGHQQRATAYRREAAAIDRVIGLYKDGIKRLSGSGS